MLRIHRLTRAALYASVPAILALGAITMAPTPAAAQIGIEITANVAPPPLFEYEQPPIPAPGYLWTPGYWSYGEAGYYWVPGTWVEPPTPGLLWTPGYWGFAGGRYVFNAGYWGPTVGFYGGINYGFGYGGIGFEGGFWRGGVFQYNRAVNNFGGLHITNVYDKRVTNVTVNRVSFNGPGGIDRRPTPAEEAAMHEHHIAATQAQLQQRTLASQNRELRADVNHGRPPIAATPRPGDFKAAPAAEGRPNEAARPGEAARPEAADRAATRPPVAHTTHTVRTARPAHATHVARPQARPDEHTEARPEEHREARPEEHTAARPEAHREARPEEHNTAARPEEHTEARPAPHPAPRPASHPAPRPAPHPAPHDDKKPK